MLDLQGKRVLVVEDESLVAMLFVDLLNEIGCESAATASDVDDAMEQISSLPFDLCILDVNLDGQQAFDLARELQRRQIPFLFTTGYETASIPHEFGDVPTLSKPFQPKDLEAAIDAALSALTIKQGNVPIDVEIGGQALPALSR